MWEVKLNRSIFDKHADIFIVYGYDEHDALENLLSEQSPRFTQYLISDDEVDRMIQNELPSFKYNETAARELVESSLIYIDRGWSIYADDLRSIKEAPEVYQVMDDHQLSPEDPEDPRSIILSAYDEPIVKCDYCGSVMPANEYSEQIEDGVRYAMCPDCRSTSDLYNPAYRFVRLADVKDIKRYGEGPEKGFLSSASRKSKGQPKRVARRVSLKKPNKRRR